MAAGAGPGAGMGPGVGAAPHATALSGAGDCVDQGSESEVGIRGWAAADTDVGISTVNT
jgi:hypothetical protein